MCEREQSGVYKKHRSMTGSLRSRPLRRPRLPRGAAARGEQRRARDVQELRDGMDGVSFAHETRIRKFGDILALDMVGGHETAMIACLYRSRTITDEAMIAIRFGAAVALFASAYIQLARRENDEATLDVRTYDWMSASAHVFLQ